MSDIVISPSVNTVVVRPSVLSPLVSPSTVNVVVEPSVLSTIVDPTVVAPVISPVFGEQGPTGPAGPGGADGLYGSFFDTTTQTNDLSINTMRFDTTAESTGVSIVAGSRITVTETGVYNVQFSAQFDKTDSGDDDIEVWLAKNGNEVDWSNTRLSLHGNNAKAVPAWNFMLTLTPSDYLELRWYSPDADMRILAFPAQVAPSRPAIPSIILTVQQVMYTQVGPAGPTGATGPAGPSFTYVHTQALPATTWNVAHNLNGYPNVTVVDSAGDVIEPDLEYLSVNSVRLILASATSGYAYLS